MRSIARIHNSRGEHHVKLSTGDRTSKIEIPPKPSGFGSSATGGELLLLALATCYCNDVYREAARIGLEVSHVDVECSGDFPAEGQPAQDVTYTVRITANGSPQQIRELAAQVDQVAEIHNTLRAGTPVVMTQAKTESV
jgi:organic hydroperoxide reductase OsmC/OhrA